MNDGYAWIEGEYVPIAEARIPILDTGFVRSDLTYDVVGVWGGSFFRLDDHLDRLERGCERIRLQSPLTRARPSRSSPRSCAAAGCARRTSRRW